MSDDKLSCGVVLARATDAGYVTLMLRAWHHWDFPKGLMEEGEEPVQAALRELREETGIATTEFEWGERHMDTGPYSRGKTARYFLARTAACTGSSPSSMRPFGKSQWCQARSISVT